MQLYKMELYKICHKRMTIAGAIAAILLLAAGFFMISLGDQESTVDGVTYYGYEAVRKDREITRDFEGILTDENVAEIVERYGFPKEVQEGYGYWQDANYLTKFVFDYLSDGYINDWNDYRVAEYTIPMRQSEYLVDFIVETEGGIPFAYTNGWESFLDFFGFGMILASIFVILAVTPLFAEERQLKVKPILGTTEYGVTRDVSAKLLTAFTVALFSYLSVLIGGLLLFGMIFGFDGGEMTAGRILHYAAYWRFANCSIFSFMALVAIASLAAIIMLTALAIFFSVMAGTSYQAVILTLLVWAAPLLVMLLHGDQILYLLACMQPMMLGMYAVLMESSLFFELKIGFATVITFLCIYFGQRRWKRMEME